MVLYKLKDYTMRSLILFLLFTTSYAAQVQLLWANPYSTDLNITQGDLVVWNWLGTGHAHNVILTRTVPASPALQIYSGNPGYNQYYLYQFNDVEEWDAHCQLHPTTMLHHIKVSAVTTTPVSTTTTTTTTVSTTVTEGGNDATQTSVSTTIPGEEEGGNDATQTSASTTSTEVENTTISPTAAEESSDDEMEPGIIVAIVCGVVILVGIVGIIIYRYKNVFFNRKTDLYDSDAPLIN